MPGMIRKPQKRESNLVSFPCAVAVALFFAVGWLLFCVMVISARQGFASPASRAISPPAAAGAPDGRANGPDARSGLRARIVLVHDAIPTAAQPLGWSYPWSCCSGQDCRQVKAKVRETPEGYVVPSGEVLAMSDPRIKPSPDGEFPWCTVAGEDTSRTICLFVPPRGM